MVDRGALVAVIVVAIAVIVVVLHSNSGGNSTLSATSASASGIASANDNGPVTVITEDPSCATWTPVINTLADEALGPVMKASDERFEQLGRLSDNPVLEDLAVLTAQYGDAFVQGLPSYVAGDHYLYAVTTNSTGVVGEACEAVGAK